MDLQQQCDAEDIMDKVNYPHLNFDLYVKKDLFEIESKRYRKIDKLKLKKIHDLSDEELIDLLAEYRADAHMRHAEYSDDEGYSENQVKFEWLKKVLLKRLMTLTFIGADNEKNKNTL